MSCKFTKRSRYGGWVLLIINPSATTAKGSFHGTGISIFQLPSHSNSGIVRDPIVIEESPSRKLSLPDEMSMYLLYPAKLISSLYHNLLVVMKLLVFLKLAGPMRKNGFNMAFSY